MISTNTNFNTLTFYLLVYAYEEETKSEKILEVSTFMFRNFILEMSWKILRSLFQGAVHGMLIARNILQLLSLVVLDLMIVILSIKYSKSFKSNVIFILMTSYFFLFLCFDITLIIYTYDDSNDKSRNSIYNIVFVVIICLSILNTWIKIITIF